MLLYVSLRLFDSTNRRYSYRSRSQILPREYLLDGKLYRSDITKRKDHCGDVLTRKTYTPDFHTHKAKKNYGKKPQSLYKNHHEAIVSRDDFIAVQHMLDNAKYGNKSFLPELKVISSGILKGFVIINPALGGIQRNRLSSSRSKHLRTTCGNRYRTTDSC